MKFILLSNVATLAVLATAPGASAAGLRARAKSTASQSTCCNALGSEGCTDPSFPIATSKSVSFTINGIQLVLCCENNNNVVQSPQNPACAGSVYSQGTTDPSSVDATDDEVKSYCEYLSATECNSDQECSDSGYCAPAPKSTDPSSVDATDDELKSYCEYLSTDECNSDQECSDSGYCAPAPAPKSFGDAHCTINIGAGEATVYGCESGEVCTLSGTGCSFYMDNASGTMTMKIDTVQNGDTVEANGGGDGCSLACSGSCRLTEPATCSDDSSYINMVAME